MHCTITFNVTVFQTKAYFFGTAETRFLEYCVPEIRPESFPKREKRWIREGRRNKFSGEGELKVSTI